MAEYAADSRGPERVILDSRGGFTSRLLQDWGLQRDLARCNVTPYHPQSHAVPEQMHPTLRVPLAAPCYVHPVTVPKTSDVHPVTVPKTSTGSRPAKVHHGSEEWLLYPRSEEPEQEQDEVVEPLPPRTRRPPRRLITEC